MTTTINEMSQVIPITGATIGKIIETEIENCFGDKEPYFVLFMTDNFTHEQYELAIPTEVCYLTRFETEKR